MLFWVSAASDSTTEHLLLHQSFHRLHPSDFGNTYFTTSRASVGLYLRCSLCHEPPGLIAVCLSSLSLSLFRSLQMACCAKCKWFSWLTSSVGCQLPPSSLQHTFYSETEVEFRTKKRKSELTGWRENVTIKPSISFAHSRTYPKSFLLFFSLWIYWNFSLTEARYRLLICSPGSIKLSHSSNYNWEKINTKAHKGRQGAPLRYAIAPFYKRTLIILAYHTRIHIRAHNPCFILDRGLILLLRNRVTLQAFYILYSSNQHCFITQTFFFFCYICMKVESLM